MGFLYRSLGTYEPLIYIVLAIVGLFVFRQMWVAWREWRDSVYTLEREFAVWRLVRRTALGFLIMGLFFGEFYIATFVAPSLPASDLLTTPTLDLLATPPATEPLVDPTTGVQLPTQPAQNGMSGCVADEIMITSPKPGEEVKAEVNIMGTAMVPDFGFYKYEIAPVGGTQNWATISASREPKKNELLGKWNTLSLSNGDYFLRLVITDNVGRSLEPCVISVRVLNQ